MQADVGEAARMDRRERLRHAVDERLDADEASARLSLGLCDQMLAAAKADLHPHVRGSGWKQAWKVGRRRLIEIDRELRQQRLKQRRLLALERMSLAPPQEGALPLF